jgi:peptidoglycan/LPS O-acetylase OafA/YrhL
LRYAAWLRQFTAASYSIYLVHTLVEGPVMSTGKIFRLCASEIRVIVVTAIAAGYPFQFMIELPLAQLVKKICSGKIKSHSPGIVPEAASVSV